MASTIAQQNRSTASGAPANDAGSRAGFGSSLMYSIEPDESDVERSLSANVTGDLASAACYDLRQPDG